MAGRVSVKTSTAFPQKRPSQYQEQFQHREHPEPRYNGNDKLPAKAGRRESKNETELSRYAELLKKQMAPLRLKDAEESGDYDALEEAVRALQDEHLRDDVDRAISRLNQINKFREELLQACEQQNRQLILAILRNGARADVCKFCRFEVKQAERLAGELGVKAHPVPAIPPINRNIMTEIRTYSKPSPLVHTVLQAVFLLLEEDEEKTSKWTYCQALCKPDGPHGFLRKIMTFRVENVDPYILNRVNSLIQGIELRTILKSSPAAAIFYVWLRSMLEPFDYQSDSEQSSTTSNSQRPTKATETEKERKKIIEKEKEIFGRRQHT